MEFVRPIRIRYSVRISAIIGHYFVGWILRYTNYYSLFNWEAQFVIFVLPLSAVHKLIK